MQSVALPEDAVMGDPRIEPNIERIGHFFVVIRLGAQ